MNKITSLKILIVGLTAVLALTNLEEFRKGKVKCRCLESNTLTEQMIKE